MADVFDTLLLLALPASGKSEVRTLEGGLRRACDALWATWQEVRA